MNQTNKYSVIGYDQNNDVFICYNEFEILADAMKTAKELAKQIDSEELKRKCPDGTESLINWIEIYWNWNQKDEEFIWGSYDN